MAKDGDDGVGGVNGKGGADAAKEAHYVENDHYGDKADGKDGDNDAKAQDETPHD